MGQAQSVAENVIPDYLDTAHKQVLRHAKVFSEINSLTYDDFKNCLENLNELARKCISPNGKQLVFLVKSGTDTSLLWKATIKIACIKVDPITRKIDSYKLLNLKQFLCVFKTFQAHLESLVSSENRKHSRRSSESSLSEYGAAASISSPLTASVIMDQVKQLVGSSSVESTSGSSSPTTICSHVHADHIDECSICLDRKTEVILPCAHSFCTPCIEQWNVNNKTCPVCCEELKSTDDTWVLSNIPGVEEINDEICAEFMSLSKADP